MLGRDGIEKAVGSFGFSVLCFLVWGSLTVSRARSLPQHFSWMEVAWLVYCATIAALFLVRSKPTTVSLNPLHWAVALFACFSGFLFEKESGGIPGAGLVGDGLILLGLAGSFGTAIALRRSYDFLPALRGVSTDWLYRFVRHPMYLSGIITHLGYEMKHASIWNVVALLISLALCLKRIQYEEGIMGRDERYLEYARQVRFRLLPGIY